MTSAVVNCTEEVVTKLLFFTVIPECCWRRSRSVDRTPVPHCLDPACRSNDHRHRHADRQMGKSCKNSFNPAYEV